MKSTVFSLSILFFTLFVFTDTQRAIGQNRPVSKNKEINQYSSDDLEQSNSVIFNHQPGAVKSIKIVGKEEWTIELDLLSLNHKWLPGVDSTGGFFLNLNPKIRTLTIKKSCKTFACDSSGVSTLLIATSIFISKLQKWLDQIQSESSKFDCTAYFDIKGNEITAIYEQCLP